MAVLVELLAFYRALFERSCDAVNALANALHTHYTWQGFHVTDKEVNTHLSVMICHVLTSLQGSTIQEPFCRALR